MSYFLLKTEPTVYSFDDLVRDGGTVWDGVTNNLALKNLRTAKVGDTCMIYHSGDEKAAVGIAKVSRAAYPDPKEKDEKLVVINIKAVGKFKKPVTLAELKNRRELKDFKLVRIPRLSVMPVPEDIWKLIVRLSKKE